MVWHPRESALRRDKGYLRCNIQRQPIVNLRNKFRPHAKLIGRVIWVRSGRVRASAGLLELSQLKIGYTLEKKRNAARMTDVLDAS